MMTVDMREVYRAKAHGINSSIAKIIENSQGGYISAELGRDYNKLLSAIKQDYPDLAETMPPILNFKNVDNRTVCPTTFMELSIYSSQIYEILGTIT